MDCRQLLIAATTPLFARKGLHGVSVRELASAADTNVSMISYHFGGKLGLYEAVLREVCSGMLEAARVAKREIPAAEKFRQYVYQCGICFHAGDGTGFVPRTASADPDTPECPNCLNNDADSFTETRKPARDPDAQLARRHRNRENKRNRWPTSIPGPTSLPPRHRFSPRKDSMASE